MKTLLQIALTLVLLNTVATGAMAQQIPSSLKKGMTYDETRQVVMNAGWTPIVTATENPLDGTARWREKGYTEVEACSGTGMGFCRFTFSGSKQQKLVIITAGRDSSLYSWSIEPAKPSVQTTRESFPAVCTFINSKNKQRLVDDRCQVSQIRENRQLSALTFRWADQVTTQINITSIDSRDRSFLSGTATVDGSTAKFQSWKTGNLCFTIDQTQHTVCYRKK